jgi:hypothetical protein
VSAEDSRSEEDLCDGIELHLSWTLNFLDPVPGGSGDAQVLLQSSKPTGENWSFSPEGLYLIRISVHLLILGVAWGRVLYTGLVFYVLVLQLLLLLSKRALSRWALGNHQLHLKRLLLL